MTWQQIVSSGCKRADVTSISSPHPTRSSTICLSHSDIFTWPHPNYITSNGTVHSTSHSLEVSVSGQITLHVHSALYPVVWRRREKIYISNFNYEMKHKENQKRGMWSMDCLGLKYHFYKNIVYIPVMMSGYKLVICAKGRMVESKIR